MSYTMTRFDEAIDNSLGTDTVRAIREGGMGSQRPMLLLRAAQVRWINNTPEDEDALVLRAAYSDLIVHGFFKFEES